MKIRKMKKIVKKKKKIVLMTSQKIITDNIMKVVVKMMTMIYLSIPIELSMKVVVKKNLIE